MQRELNGQLRNEHVRQPTRRAQPRMIGSFEASACVIASQLRQEGFARTYWNTWNDIRTYPSTSVTSSLATAAGPPASWTDAGHGVCDDHARQMLRQGPPREPLSEPGRCAGRLRVFRYAAPLDTGREVLQRQRRELRVEPIRRASSRLFTRFM